MHLPSNRVDIAALASVVVGLVMLLIAGFIVWHGDSSTAGIPSRDAYSPFDTNSKGLQNLRPTQRADNTGNLPGFQSPAGSGDPFAGGGNDGATHKVTVSVVSDGAIYVGYRYRDGRKGGKVAQQSFSNSASVHGPLPLAQVAAQVIGNGTYATCSITIDGAKVASYTAKGSGHVVVCTD